MRVMITFIGFLGMIVHFSQKTNVSIALVCMVNHSAIERHGIVHELNEKCLTTNRTNHLVNIRKKKEIFNRFSFRMDRIFGVIISKVLF